MGISSAGGAKRINIGDRASQKSRHSWSVKNAIKSLRACSRTETFWRTCLKDLKLTKLGFESFCGNYLKSCE